MTDHLVSPEWTLSIGGKPYRLDCSFRTLKAIQHAVEKDILDVLIDLPTMRFEQHAHLIEIAIGADSPAREAIEEAIVDEIGIAHVRSELRAWLIVAVTPKRDREKKAREVTEALTRLRAADSPGGTTSSSPSASLAGPRRRSGRATSGS